MTSPASYMRKSKQTSDSTILGVLEKVVEYNRRFSSNLDQQTTWKFSQKKAITPWSAVGQNPPCCFPGSARGSLEIRDSLMLFNQCVYMDYQRLSQKSTCRLFGRNGPSSSPWRAQAVPLMLATHRGPQETRKMFQDRHPGAAKASRSYLVCELGA